MNRNTIVEEIKEVGLTDELENKLHEIDRAIYRAKEYLLATDWYYARKLETNEEVPEDVDTKRTEARELIRSIEDGK